ncbi:MAG TPA: hypothetical protein VF551_02730 [Chthoniobacterales bacterium]
MAREDTGPTVRLKSVHDPEPCRRWRTHSATREQEAKIVYNAAALSAVSADVLVAQRLGL